MSSYYDVLIGCAAYQNLFWWHSFTFQVSLAIQSYLKSYINYVVKKLNLTIHKVSNLTVNL